MARLQKYKRPTAEQVKAMTPQEKLEHKRALERERSARMHRRRMAGTKKAERRQRAQEETTLLYSWERLLPHIRRLENGCWLWTGGFKVLGGVVRPRVRAGVYGDAMADHVICCLHRGRPPPYCFVSRTCETLGCVSPHHLVWSNQVVQTAKRRRQHEQEVMAGRLER